MQNLGIHFILAGSDKSLPVFTLPLKYLHSSFKGTMLILLPSCTSHVCRMLQLKNQKTTWIFFLYCKIIIHCVLHK